MRTFTTRQVAAIAATIVVAVMLAPTAVRAASTALTRITDGHGHIAKVDKGGHVLVGDGHGSLTVDGKVNVTSGSSPLRVAGTVNSVPASPGQPWNTVNGVGLSTGNSYAATIYSGTGGQNLNLTSFAAAAFGSTAGSIHLFVQVLVAEDATSHCPQQGNFAAAERFDIVVPVGQTVTMSYPTPLVYSAYAHKDWAYCVNASATAPANDSLDIFASGYLS